MNIQSQFIAVISLIKQARYEAFKSVNTKLINLYWEIGLYISKRTESEGWGKSTVQQLADYIQKQEPDLKGFSDKNLWRMKQFYETYKDSPKLSTLLRELSWSHNLAIFSRCKTMEEKEFYLVLAKDNEVVEYALSRNLSPTLISQYTTILPDKKLLQAKLHELYERFTP